MANEIKQECILVADDNSARRSVLKDLFRGCRVAEASNGKEALQIITREYQSIVVILLAVDMPVMDGMAVLRILKEKKILNRIPVVLIAEEASSEAVAEEGYELGAADIIRQPFNNRIIIRRVKNLTEQYGYKNRLEDRVRQQMKHLEAMHDRILEVMCGVVESKEEESPEHITNVKRYTRIIAEKISEKYQEYELDDKKIELITKGSVLHDIGKVAIDDSVLKKTTRLTKDEMRLLQSHTTKGSEMVQEMADIQDEEYLKVCYDICRYHHEKYDGRGYPDGLKGEEIPIAAQIVGLADTYDKLTSDNIRRRAYGNKEAVQMILDGECGEFSPKLIECFAELKDVIV